MSTSNSGRTMRLAALAILLTPLAAQAKESPAAQKNFLWKVTAKNGNTLHLLGSIHMADASTYPLPRAMEDAFAASDVLVVEADIDQVDAASLMRLTMQKGLLTDGRTLSQVVSKETWRLVEKAADGIVPVESLEPFQPWFASMTIASAAIAKTGLDPKYGIDRHFLSQRGEREVVELEGMAFQIGLLSDFTLAQQEQLLVWTLADIDTLERELEKLVKAWKSGDETVLESIVTESARTHPDAKPVIDALIHKRNARMVAKVEQMLKTTQTEFVVVGAAHLVGDSGLVRQLLKKGYRLEQL